jgi:hypothetical protein
MILALLHNLMLAFKVLGAHGNESTSTAYYSISFSRGDKRSLVNAGDVPSRSVCDGYRFSLDPELAQNTLTHICLTHADIT